MIDITWFAVGFGTCAVVMLVLAVLVGLVDETMTRRSK